MKQLSHFIFWKLGLAKAWTWYTETECSALEKYAKGKKCLAEIGCWQGVNTSRLRKVMDPNGIIMAIDPYPKGRLGFNAAEVIAHHEASGIKVGSICWIKKTDLEAAADIEKSPEYRFDFIFSDSLNTYAGAKKTWEAWNQLLQPGGIYVIANSVSTPEKPIEGAGIVRFVRDVILQETSFEHLETVGCFTILRKK